MGHFGSLRGAAHLLVIALHAAAACSPSMSAAPPEASAPARPASSAAPAPKPPEPVALELGTGRMAPRKLPSVQLRASAREVTRGRESLRVELPPLSDDAGGIVELGPASFVRLESDAPHVAVVGPDARGVPSLFVRRPASAEPVRGTIYTPAHPSRHEGSSRPGHEVPFVIDVPAGTPIERHLSLDLYDALAWSLDSSLTPFSVFAATRLRERRPPTAEQRRLHAQLAFGRRGDADLTELMDTFTGRLSVQLALQNHRHLVLPTARAPRKVPIAELEPPRVPRHDWRRLRAAVRHAAPAEPLAGATPADFYFLRARSVTALLDVIDVAESWGQPVAALLDARVEDRGTFVRYQTELGLDRTAVARVLGPTVVEQLAIVGSDPYVHEGSDVTLILQPKSASGLSSLLDLAVQATASRHGGLTTSTLSHAGVRVEVRASPDGRVRQHRATVAGLVLISNSQGAISRVIAAATGAAPRLADELDFGYMLARDATVPEDLLVYLGEAFIDAVVGPRQKIAEARRQIALSELMVPGFSALLHGAAEGAAPATNEDMFAAGWLSPSELRHADGPPITFRPGESARSRWGSVSALEPLADLPAVDRVTQAEADSYRRFAQGYAATWGDAIDPVALRIDHARQGSSTRLAADLRVLPLLRGEYRELVELVGDGAVVVPALPSGARLTAALGQEARLRRELSAADRALGLGKRLELDWLGDWVMLGTADRNELWNALRLATAGELEPPGAPARPRNIDDLLAKLPVYGAVAVRSRLGAAAVLTLLRKSAKEHFEGARFSSATYRGQNLVRASAESEAVSLHYALLDEALVVALSRAGLETGVDLMLDGQPSSPDAQPDASAAQVVLEARTSPSRALGRMLTFAATKELVDYSSGSYALSLALLRGAPDAASSAEVARARMRDTFGTVLLAPEGGQYTLTTEGLRDPARGTLHAPEWPALPVAGSPVARALSPLASVRTSLSFEQEPGSLAAQPVRSLRARVTVVLDQPR